MYRTCLFCNADLGQNQSIEHLPIGRRIAFDAANGRLWVVCRKCERWNLTPFDDRWEAIEQCERFFRDTRTRLSTDQIGLARLKDRTDLVRIGEPLRPEFAAWRYGDQFGQRRRKHLVMVGIGTTLVVGAAVAPLLMIGAGVGGGGLWNVGSWVHSLIERRRVVARISGPDGLPLALTQPRVDEFELRPTPDDPWRVCLPPSSNWDSKPKKRPTYFEGPIGRAVLQKILPRVNRSGASRRQVDGAVELLEQTPDGSGLVTKATRSSALVSGFAPELRLALEMSVHEDAERRWLAGELLDLETAWQEAEELAAIADKLGIPAEVESHLQRLRVDAK